MDIGWSEKGLAICSEFGPSNLKEVWLEMVRG